MKPDFDKAQNAATKFLLSQDIKSLYIDVRNFVLPSDVIIVSIQEFSRNTGFDSAELKRRCIDGGACLVRDQGFNFIFYDDDIPNEQRKHWGITHELGHIFLEHTNDKRESEIEAHFFAAQLIAPEIVLWELYKRKGKLSDYDLFTHFNLSYEAASKRITTLNRRSGFNCADIDKQLLCKFTPIIDKEISHFLVS